tara:strand:- start:227 stop:1057 length:831 start_codon:yes stop_codon:yes gene_type:complete
MRKFKNFKKDILNIIKSIKRKIFKFFKDKFYELNPFSQIGEAVAQIYICDDSFKSVFGINNFLSYLAPLSDSSGKLFIRIYSKNGTKYYEHKINLFNMQSEFIFIEKFLKRINSKSEMGIISCKFKPNKSINKDHKLLGRIFSQPFIYYFNKSGAVSLIHPLSIVTDQKKSDEWISNQTICVNGIKKIHLYQCNPSYKNHKTRYCLRDIDNSDIYESKELYIPRMGVKKLTFDLENIKSLDKNVSLRLFCSSLPSPNSKPLICREFKNKMISMSHS